MKLTSFILFAVIFALSFSAYGDTINFEDYKKLSTVERQKLSTDAAEDLKGTYKNWDEIINMGGQWWGPRQGNSFINTKGFADIGALMNTQRNLFGNFVIAAQKEVKKSTMSKEARNTVLLAFDKEGEAIEKDYILDTWYLVKLAATPEAQALNVKAGKLLRELEGRFPLGRQWTITRKDMDRINADVNEIRQQMRKLPQLTPEQIQAGLAALPVEDESGGPHR